MPPSNTNNVENSITCVDLFCGAGGLTRGLELEGVFVAAGIDSDWACRYAYEENNDARFIRKKIENVEAVEIAKLYPKNSIRVLAGCAPCQPFSTYRQGIDHKSDLKWGLLYEFDRLVRSARPEIVTMENVPSIRRHEVFDDFVAMLHEEYQVQVSVVACSMYGVPQTRQRLVVLASRLGPIKLVSPTQRVPMTVREAIENLRAIKAGGSDEADRLHTSSSLSPLNMRRIQASRPGGTWRDWPEELIADCHKANSGKTYPGVYGRMEWDKPAPTMTTQCYGFGNGRFGHPEQDRAISLREAAILQSFPPDYEFIEPESKVEFKTAGRLIGNAVPVNLARAIGRSIVEHVNEFQAAGRAISSLGRQIEVPADKAKQHAKKVVEA